jgi:hypothetical protein
MAKKLAQFEFGCPNCHFNFYVSSNYTMNPFFPRYCPSCGYDAYDSAPVNPLNAKEPVLGPNAKGTKGGFAIGGFDTT